MELTVIPLRVPEDVNLILGQSHFIKTVEDLHEALVGAVPGIQFGLAFGEASGPALVRWSGTDEELIELARTTMYELGTGHAFLILLRNAFPINVLPAGAASPGGLPHLLRDRQSGRGDRGRDRAGSRNPRCYRRLLVRRASRRNRTSPTVKLSSVTSGTKLPDREQILQHDGDAVVVAAGGDTIRRRPRGRGGAGHGYCQPRFTKQPDIILTVPDCDHRLFRCA